MKFQIPNFKLYSNYLSTNICLFSSVGPNQKGTPVRPHNVKTNIYTLPLVTCLIHASATLLPCGSQQCNNRRLDISSGQCSPHSSNFHTTTLHTQLLSRPLGLHITSNSLPTSHDSTPLSPQLWLWAHNNSQLTWALIPHQKALIPYQKYETHYMSLFISFIIRQFIQNLARESIGIPLTVIYLLPKLVDHHRPLSPNLYYAHYGIIMDDFVINTLIGFKVNVQTSAQEMWIAWVHLSKHSCSSA